MSLNYRRKGAIAEKQDGASASSEDTVNRPKRSENVGFSVTDGNWKDLDLCLGQAGVLHDQSRDIFSQSCSLP